jgi:hypothetical protein
MLLGAVARLKQKPVGVIDRIIVMPSRTSCRQGYGSESGNPKASSPDQVIYRHGGTQTLTIGVLGWVHPVHRCFTVNSEVTATHSLTL